MTIKKGPWKNEPPTAESLREIERQSEETMRRKRVGAAAALVGRPVRFAHLLPTDVMRVTGATDDGFVTVTKFPGDFSPFLFVVVEEVH